MQRLLPPASKTLILSLLLLAGLLAACASESGSTVTPAAETGLAASRNADGTYTLGDPDAPVTLIDYGDFL